MQELEADVKEWQRRGRHGVRMISPEEAQQHHGLIDPKQVLGAMFVPRDYYGRVDATGALKVLSERVTNAGREFPQSQPTVNLSLDSSLTLPSHPD